MADKPDGQNLDETRRIMERLVNTPPQPKGGKEEKEGKQVSRRTAVKKDSRK